MRATVEPQGTRSVPQIRRIAATHEASAFFLPWSRIAAKPRPSVRGTLYSLVPASRVRDRQGSGSRRPCGPINRRRWQKRIGRIYMPVNHGSLLRPRRGFLPCNRTVCVLAVPVKPRDCGVENQTGLFRRCFPCRRFIRRRSPLGRRALQSAYHPE